MLEEVKWKEQVKVVDGWGMAVTREGPSRPRRGIYRGGGTVGKSSTRPCTRRAICSIVCGRNVSSDRACGQPGGGVRQCKMLWHVMGHDILTLRNAWTHTYMQCTSLARCPGALASNARARHPSLFLPSLSPRRSGGAVLQVLPDAVPS